MSSKLRMLILALAMSGVTALAWAQTGPESADGPSSGSAADTGAAPPHAWHQRESDDQQGPWRSHEPGAERDGEWYGHRHHHPHYCHHHHHHHYDRGGGEAWGGHGRYGQGWGGREAWHRPAPGMMAGVAMLRALHTLDLSAAQQQQVHTMLAEARAKLATQQAAGAPDIVALANPGDPNHAAAIEAAKKRAVDRIQRASDLQLQLYKVLTPEQKSELTKRLAQWKANSAQRADGEAKRQPAPANR